MVVTPQGRDGGIDGYGRLKIGLAYMNVAFQCKRFNDLSVGRPKIDEFRGAIQGEYEQGIFFTTSKFVETAKDASLRRGAVPIVLVDGPGIVNLMIGKQFGVQAEEIPVYSYALDLVLSDDSADDMERKLRAS
ncbi:MAG: restriction system protein [Verrucomicrobiota bacterium]